MNNQELFALLQKCGADVAMINGHYFCEPLDEKVVKAFADAIEAQLKAQGEQEQTPVTWSWVCNECDSHELTSAITEQDLKYQACTNCGCDEFHKEYAAPPLREGWVSVPIVPDEMMIVHGMEASVLGRPSMDDESYVLSIYKSMIAADSEEGRNG